MRELQRLFSLYSLCLLLGLFSFFEVAQCGESAEGTTRFIRQVHDPFHAVFRQGCDAASSLPPCQSTRWWLDFDVAGPVLLFVTPRQTPLERDSASDVPAQTALNSSQATPKHPNVIISICGRLASNVGDRT